MADDIQDSMRADTVPGNPPSDAPRSAGLPLQAKGGPQAEQGPQARDVHQAGMGAVDRLGHEYPIEGLAAPPGVFSDAVQLSTIVRTVCGCLLCQFSKTALVVCTFADNAGYCTLLFLMSQVLLLHEKSYFCVLSCLIYQC